MRLEEENSKLNLELTKLEDVNASLESMVEQLRADLDGDRKMKMEDLEDAKRKMHDLERSLQESEDKKEAIWDDLFQEKEKTRKLATELSDLQRTSIYPDNQTASLITQIQTLENDK